MKILKDLDLEAIKDFMHSEKLILIRGQMPMERDEFLGLIQSISPKLLHWSFGPVMDLKVDEKSENYLFSNEKVPFHWDGAFHVEPSFLAFNCIQAPEAGAGGETLFCDTERLYAALTEEELEALRSCRLTYRTEKKAHYGGEVTVPMLQSHPRTGVPILRFAEAVETALNPVSLSIEGVPEPEKLEARMRDLIYDPRFSYQHRWQDGDILLVDNFSVIHGRNAFSRATPRHLRRIQML